MRWWLIGMGVGIASMVGVLAWHFDLFSAPASPAVGTWKLTVLAGPDEITTWLVQIELKDGKLRGRILDVGYPDLRSATLEAVRADDRAVYLTFKKEGAPLAVVGHFHAEEKSPKVLLGSMEARGGYDFLKMERTEETRLDATTAPAKTTPLGDELKKAAKSPESLRQFIQEYPQEPAAYAAVVRLLTQLPKDHADEVDVRRLTEQAISIAAAYGPEMELQANLELSRSLRGRGQFAALRLHLARAAEKHIRPGAPLHLQSTILQTLLSALRETNHQDELPPLEQRLAAIEEQLDEEFRKDAIPFAPKPYPGRGTRSDRAVLVELFTGVQCPPCVAADIAFDALRKTYSSTEAVLLQYHLHVPGPDPLTNPDSIKRAEYYGVDGTPALYVSGMPGPEAGGFRQHAWDRYTELIKQINPLLDSATPVVLKLTARRNGEMLELTTQVSELKETGDNVRLRLAIVEDEVRYVGRNRQRLHHHVVRDFPGGVEGVPLREKSGEHRAVVNVAELRKKLSDYLATVDQDASSFTNRPLALTSLKVVAFVQSDATREVLQAAQAPIE